MLILATVKDAHEAARRFRLLKQAVDEPAKIRAFARGVWTDDRGVPVHASYPGVEVTHFTGRTFMTAKVDGEPVKIIASPVPKDREFEEVAIYIV